MGSGKTSKKGRIEPSSENSRAVRSAAATEGTQLPVADYQAQIDDLKAENRILREALQFEGSTHPETDIDFGSWAPVGCRSAAADALPPSGGPFEEGWPEKAQCPVLPEQNAKSLSCIFEIDRLASENGQSLEQILQSIAAVLPVAWPNKTVEAAGIVIGKRKFLSGPSVDGPPDLKRDLLIQKRKAGSVFLKMKSPSTAAPDPGESFERDHQLLNAVAVKLDSLLDHHQRMGFRRRVEAKFQKIFDTSPDAIIVSRLDDGRLIDVNDGFCALSGYRREEVIAKSSLELNLWLDEAQRLGIVETLRRKEQMQNVEIPFRRKDGSRLAALVSAS